MTERSESERAELVALADRCNAAADGLWADNLAHVPAALRDAASALRRLAAQDQYLSAHPHASDCDKQGWLAKDVEAATKRVAEWKNETTKSEGGVEGHALQRAGWPEASKAKEGGPSQAGIKPGPSDRPADVTVDELAAMIVPEGAQVIGAQDAKQIAAEILDAFTVGRR